MASSLDCALPARFTPRAKCLLSFFRLIHLTTNERTAVEVSHDAMAPKACDDLAFTDLVRLAGP